ncbi:hypothetical protein MBLNU459_g3806t1 [Dothideomycetes sp. NU459]
MADAAAAPAPPAADAASNRGRQPRGGQRGGRAGQRPRDGDEHGEPGHRERAPGASRGRGRGRGNRARRNSQGEQQQQQQQQRTPTDSDGPPVLAPGKARMFGAALTAAAPADHAEQPQDEVEAEVCFICASPVVHNSVAPCNHRTCHICALRLRALYKTKACAHCRTEAQTVIFTDDAVKRFEDFTDADFSSVDPNLGIRYEQQDIFEDTVLLLRYNCPDPSCDAACLGWPDLHRHVKSVHHKMMCDLCTRNKKVFTHEHELFTQAELRKHEKYGDDNPGAVDQSGFKGHPECGFCRERFYGDDELYAHCRDKHERCHICDRRNGGRQPQYYLDYNALEVHFRKDHFVCPDQECLDKKFVVFDSEMDLKAHQLEAHPNGLTKDAKRDARRVDISGFDYRTPHQQDRPQRRERGERGERGEREGRGRGRGRDPNAEALPVSSAQPMRRDEIAYQRQMAIQSAQSVSNRTFGGQLTQQPEAYAARPPPDARDPPTVTAPRPPPPDPFPSLGSSLQPSAVSSARNSAAPSPRSSSPERPSAPLTPAEQARRLRHNAVNERASNLLRNDGAKLAEFRNKVSAYRNGGIKAGALVETFFSLFDTSSAELGKLIKELADIFEIPGKRDQLLNAWNDWKAINEDYPSLPGPSGPASSSSTAAGILGAGIGASRVLKLKSSTQQSSRSAVSKSGSWGSATNGRIFPPASASSNSASAISNRMPGPVARASPAPTPSWLSSAPASARPSAANSRTQSPAKLPAGNAFPALPKAQKPTTTIFSPGYTGRGIGRVQNSTPAASAWGAGGSATSPPAVEEPEEVQGGKKKGKGKKQVLYNWG